MRVKIIIIGAGQGGLQAAKVFADGGAEVALFEKDEADELCYDWFDDAQAKLFSDLDIPVPPGSFHGEDVALVAPFSARPLKVDGGETDKRDWAVPRRTLSGILVERARAAGAKIAFGTKVDSLIIENGRVCGVNVNGMPLRAGLVVDSSGVYSPFRASLPPEMRITAEPSPNEVFRVYRAVFAPAEGVRPPTDFPKKVYLKHIGESGISWCMTEPDGSVNVLVGRTGGLSDAVLSNALEKLREDNPIIGSELRHGGIICTIPIRYPLSRMVADGYAAVGDAAFMTIPLIGSGIANSIRAGQMLAETVLGADSADIKTLWRYQVRYYREIGAGHYCVDYIKRSLLSMKAEDIRFLFDSGVINKRDMQSISSGEAMVMTPKMIFDKALKGRKKLGVLIHLARSIGKGEKAEAFAGTIPQEFDEKTVFEWQKKADGIFDGM